MHIGYLALFTFSVKKVLLSFTQIYKNATSNDLETKNVPKISRITFLPDFVDDFFESVTAMMMVKVTIHLNANGPAVFV